MSYFLEKIRHHSTVNVKSALPYSYTTVQSDKKPLRVSNSDEVSLALSLPSEQSHRAREAAVNDKEVKMRLAAMVQLFLRAFSFRLLLITWISNGAMAESDFPSELTLKAGVIPGETFGGFQRDLLERLQLFALEDNITLTFETREIQELYTSNLPLISKECPDGETVNIEGIDYQCNNFDMIVGDYWPSPSRYEIVDFTPPWLSTSISAIKFVEKTKFPDLDITTVYEAVRKKVPVCALGDTYTERVLLESYPSLDVIPCDRSIEARDCNTLLKKEECFLWFSDELVLRRFQAGDPSLEMTGEQLQRQLLSWPMRKDLHPISSFLLNKWMYAAISNQTIEELYFDYFAQKLCPIGTAGKNCELPCDPDSGSANAAGKCVCISTRWTGDDCSTEIPEDMNVLPASLKVVSYVLFGTNVLAILGCGVWLYLKRTTPQVQISQPKFLLLVLIGCLISSSTILAFAQDDEGDGPVPACMAIPWLYSVGFSITFGALFAKIYHIYKMFSQPTTSGSVRSSNSPTRIKNMPDTLFFIGVVLLLDMLVLVAWTVIDPLAWERVDIRVDQFGDPLESQGKCISGSWKVFAGAIGCLHLVLMSIACYMCYVARMIPSKYSEHKYVTIAMISNLQLFVVGVPILIIIGEDSAASFFVRSMIVWMNDLAVLALIFGNLMYSVHRGKSAAGEEEDKHDLRVAVGHYRETNMTIINGRSDSSPKGLERAAKTEKAQEDLTTPPIKKKEFISSLSMGTHDEKKSVKSVSFSEDVDKAEIGKRKLEKDDGDTRSSEGRFILSPVQGAPLQPRRPLYDPKSPAFSKRPSLDSPIIAPLRLASEIDRGEDLDLSESDYISGFARDKESPLAVRPPNLPTREPSLAPASEHCDDGLEGSHGAQISGQESRQDMG